MLKQDKRRPLIQAAPSLQSGSAAPPKPVGVSGTPHAHLWQEERGVPEQKQRAPAQQLLEQRVLVVALRLQRQRPQQGQVPAQQTEQLQVKHSTLSHFVFTLPEVGVDLTRSAFVRLTQGEGQPEPLGHRQQSPAPLAQLLAHSQKKARFTQLHGGPQDHQVTDFLLYILY